MSLICEIAYQALKIEATILLRARRRRGWEAGNRTYHDIRILKSGSISSDTFPGFVERFADTYYFELVDFIDHLQRELPPSVTVEDGYKAQALAVAATQSFDEKRSVQVKL